MGALLPFWLFWLLRLTDPAICHKKLASAPHTQQITQSSQHLASSTPSRIRQNITESTHRIGHNTSTGGVWQGGGGEDTGGEGGRAAALGRAGSAWQLTSSCAEGASIRAIAVPRCCACHGDEDAAGPRRPQQPSHVDRNSRATLTATAKPDDPTLMPCGRRQRRRCQSCAGRREGSARGWVS